MLPRAAAVPALTDVGVVRGEPRKRARVPARSARHTRRDADGARHVCDESGHARARGVAVGHRIERCRHRGVGRGRPLHRPLAQRRGPLVRRARSRRRRCRRASRRRVAGRRCRRGGGRLHGTVLPEVRGPLEEVRVGKQPVHRLLDRRGASHDLHVLSEEEGPPVLTRLVRGGIRQNVGELGGEGQAARPAGRRVGHQREGELVVQHRGAVYRD